MKKGQDNFTEPLPTLRWTWMYSEIGCRRTLRLENYPKFRTTQCVFAFSIYLVRFHAWRTCDRIVCLTRGVTTKWLEFEKKEEHLQAEARAPAFFGTRSYCMVSSYVMKDMLSKQEKTKQNKESGTITGSCVLSYEWKMGEKNPNFALVLNSFIDIATGSVLLNANGKAMVHMR